MSDYELSPREAMNEAAITDSFIPSPSYVEILENIRDDGDEGARAEQIVFIARLWELPTERIESDLATIETWRNER